MIIGERGYGPPQWEPWTTGMSSARTQSMVYRAFDHQSLMGVNGMGGMRGLGEMSKEMQSILTSAPSTAFSTVVPLLVSAKMIAATTVWIPVIGAVVAGVTVALVLIFSRKGPKQKVATTAIVDKVEPLLKENLRGYMEGPRTKLSQTTALANYDAGWAYVVEYCDTTAMGNPGKLCVSDRDRGGRWPWAEYYRDPIANDPDVVPDPVFDANGNLVEMVTDPVTGKQVPKPFTGGTGGTGINIGGMVIDKSMLILGGAGLLLMMAMQRGGGD